MIGVVETKNVPRAHLKVTGKFNDMFNNIELVFEEAGGFRKKTKVNQDIITQKHQESVLDLNSNVDNLDIKKYKDLYQK